NPVANGNSISWSTLDKEVKAKLAEINANNGNIRIVTASINSPSTLKVLADFKAAYPTTEVVTYDAISFNGILKANELSFGKRVMPSYNIDKAKVIVGIGCDFIGNWIAPVTLAAQYAKNRKLKGGNKSMSRHIQIESTLTLTGSNADDRIRVKPSEQGSIVVSLYNKVASKAGASTVTGGNATYDAMLTKLADELWANKGNAVLMCGSNSVAEQTLVNGINVLLGAYDAIIDLDKHCNLKKSNDEAFAKLVTDMNGGNVAALIVYNCNPAYTAPNAKEFIEGIKKVSLSVSFAEKQDETAALCKYLAPDCHYLESWNDAEPFNGVYSFCQPTIQKLYKTRQAQESLLAWSGAPIASFHDYIATYWQGLAPATSTPNQFWTQIIQTGVYESGIPTKTTINFVGSVADAASKIATQKSAGEIEVLLYEKTGIGNGNQANNPWLQELPDPISKVCWDNYVCISPKMAATKSLAQGNVVKVSVGSQSLTLPVYVQPGIAEGTIAIALGYGRQKAGDADNNVGKNAYPLISFVDGSMQYYAAGKLDKTTEDNYVLAATQTHHTMMGRAIVKETTLAEYAKNPKAGNPDVLIETPEGKQRPKDIDIWATTTQPGFDRPNHSWGLGIDLNACIGCGACVVACNAENNVAVVGKDEVNRAREMHWIRIDRYYSSDTTKENAASKNLGALSMYGEMEKPSVENPKVFFQPVMCQHCNHAPCETVCPVVATTHSSDGLNMMAYNRCVGTRYCANNCPYKVRRFNWFNYAENAKFPYTQYHQSERMVLNPDVTVRSRGVMEKCSMCIQRIQSGKLTAKKESRRPVDGEINTACAQTCPTNAITFGDFTDKDSQISVMFKEDRTYWLLEEINVQPSVFYQTKVWNHDNKTEKA
ncbi:MAG TPA: 4Fe-4S dicluster domain-containing protein, partial [Bacteroidia bacterium]|nr:4Fe-4S dicluster domain-containing protein [Bacteroidia bacterium]